LIAQPTWVGKDRGSMAASPSGQDGAGTVRAVMAIDGPTPGKIPMTRLAKPRGRRGGAEGGPGRNGRTASVAWSEKDHA